MKKKMKIEDLKVKSFVTTLGKDGQQEVAGGTVGNVFRSPSPLRSTYFFPCYDVSGGARRCSYDSC